MTDASTSADLPFTANGSMRERPNETALLAMALLVASTWPGAAFVITRAARFTASPITV